MNFFYILIITSITANSFAMNYECYFLPNDYDLGTSIALTENTDKTYEMTAKDAVKMISHKVETSLTSKETHEIESIDALYSDYVRAHEGQPPIDRATIKKVQIISGKKEDMEFKYGIFLDVESAVLDQIFVIGGLPIGCY